MVTLATEPGFQNWKVVSFWERRSFSGSMSEGKPSGGGGRHVAFFMLFCCLWRRNYVQCWMKHGYQWKELLNRKSEKYAHICQKTCNWEARCKCGVCCSFVLDIFRNLEVGGSLISAAWPQIVRQSLHLIGILLILKGEKASSEMIKAALLLMPLGSSSWKASV